MDNLVTQQIPHDSAAEKAVLGAIFIDPEVINEVSSVLEPADFYEHANRLIQESAERLLRSLFGYFSERPEELPALYRETAETDIPQAVCDYLSSMTDRYAIGVFNRLFVPREGSV